MHDIHIPEQVLQMHRFANGLQIVGQSMPDAESVALAYYVPTGSRDEYGPSLEGISHFLEHMLFKGTATLDRHQLDQEFTRIGARRNGFTSIEMTFYYIQLLPEHLERGMELLSAMMYPRLLAQEFVDEKAVILNEIARAEDQPKSVALRHLLRAYFGEQPLGNNVLGTRESIRDLQLDQVRTYWQDRYVAQRVVLSIAGKFDWESFLHLAEGHTGEWQRGSSGAGSRIICAYEPAHSGRRVVVDLHRQQQIVLLAMPFVARESPDYVAAQMAASILGRSTGSRLYWRLVHQGLAVSASASLWAFEGTGLLLLRADSTPANAREVVRLLQEALDQLVEAGPTEDEVQRATALWKSAFLLSAEHPYAQMRSQALDWLVEKRLVPLAEWSARIAQVTAEDVQRVLQRFPLREKQVLTAYGPLSKQELC